MATPGRDVRRRVSAKNFRLPNNERTRGSVIVALRFNDPSATCRATLRQIVPISRSNCRTPASRV